MKSTYRRSRLFVVWEPRQNLERDKDIAIAVLRGATNVSIARRYNIAPCRVGQIVHTMCYESNNRKFTELQTNGKINVKKLREHKKSFLYRIKDIRN